MMSEVDAPAAARLRRRSFFESVEAADAAPAASPASSGQLDAVSLDLAAPTASSSSSSAATSAPAANATTPSDGSAEAPLLDAEPSDGDGGGEPKPAAWRELLRRLRAFLALLLQRWQLQLLARFPAVERAAEASRQRVARLRALWRRDPSASPVKHYAYPTHWLTVAAASLVLFQLATYVYLRAVPMDLRVDECVFRERLLAAGYERGAAASDARFPLRLASPSSALRYLERRFEQQYSALVLAQRAGQRLPWTCMAVVPTAEAPDASAAAAQQLAFFWPRAEVIDPRAPVQRASRLHVLVGPAPGVAHTGGDLAGVVAAFVPLEAFRAEIFPRRFPDLVLVKTEFALRQVLKFRDERAELQRVQQTQDDDALSWSQFGTYLLKTTVPDVYDRRVRKDWDAFLHVVVRTEQDKKEQFTEELLALWLAHPDWPTLHVRFANSAALCSSFQLLLSSLKGAEEAENADAAEENALDDDDLGDTYKWDQEDDAVLAQGKARMGLQHSKQKRKPNIDLVCDAAASSPQEIARLKNAVGVHIFPVPPEVEAYEELVLESLAAGALVMTYDSPVMQEWVPDQCGVRVGSFEVVGIAERVDEGDRETKEVGSEMRLPTVHVTPSDMEQGVASVLALDRVNRVAAGRAARNHYLTLRTHYLSAASALDVAVCDADDISADGGELPSEIGAHRRRKVEVETLRTFLY